MPGPIYIACLILCSLTPLCHSAPTTENETTQTAAPALRLPLPSPLQVALRHVLDGGTHRVDNVTRLHPGDVFNAYDVDRCVTDTCVGLSSGTAALFRTRRSGGDNDAGRRFRAEEVASSNGGAGERECRCQCLPHLTSFREDLNICVDDIHECTLAPFVSGSSAEKIPFVFLPLRGQIIHPSKEISFQGVKSPICAVSGAQYLTTTGWIEMRNPLDTDVPFRLFRDEGRTFLQWLGEPDLRYKMQGRLILVHLMCRDMATTVSKMLHPAAVDGSVGPTGQSPLAVGATMQPNIFSPCVAFRVVGTPIKISNNVTEVSFQSETQATQAANSSIGLSAKEYVAISICSLLLGLVYVASVFLYLYVKKKKSSATSSSATTSTSRRDADAAPTSGPLANDQVTFGNAFSRTNSVGAFGDKIRAGSIIGDPRRESLRMHQHQVPSGGGLNGGMYGRNGIAASLGGVEELGVVKNNPLLKHFPNFSDGSEFASDVSNSNSECEDENVVDGKMLPNMRYPSNMPSLMQHQLLHQQQQMDSSEFDYDSGNNSGGETECLPEENVSIVEDLSSDDKLENMKAIVNGTMRRKLYFNPAYFEPHLLMSPPAAAIEFLNKIREVISIAKYKMAAKRYQPSLIMIPEERGNAHHTNGADSETYYALNATRRTSSVHTPSMSRCKSSASSSCIGCPGCAEVAASNHSHSQNNNNNSNSNNNNNNNNAKSDCRNCGDKRNSIRKWLEEVSDNASHHRERPPLTEQDGEHNILDKSGESADSATVDRNASGSGSDSSGTLKASSVSSVKRKLAPPPPTSTPNATLPTPAKIISHYLKPDDTADLLEVNNKHHIRTTFNKNIAQSFAEPTKIYDKMELYNQLAKGSSGSGQLFNNPQFQHGSPQLSVRSSHRTFKSPTNSTILVQDQFTTSPAHPLQRDYEVMQSLKQQMPDMIYEAMAKDYTKRKNNHYNTSASPAVMVPQPDYDDSTLSKKYDDVPPYIQVPTPDYNTYGRSSKTNPQPDSPIYTRKSPHHLIVDYETDSLERSSTKFGRNSVSPSTLRGQQSNSSDLSSQPSPSLSNALPLEEEVEVRHTVYDRVEGFRQDGVDFVNSPRINFSSLMATPNKEPRIKYNTPSQGSMTIEVEHSPSEYELSTDSEQFEPDTLDRKSKKMHLTASEPLQQHQQQLPKNNNVNLWSKHLMKANNFVNESDESHRRYSSLENMTSLPDMSLPTDPHPSMNSANSQLILRSSGSFKSNSISSFASTNHAATVGGNETRLQKNFNSLREIYEAKNHKNMQNNNVNNNNNNNNNNVTSSAQQQHNQQQQQTQHKQRMLAIEKEKGRLLTLEARHSRRQRQTNGATTLKKPVPPDVVPSAAGPNSIYDHPKQLTGGTYELVNSPPAASKNLSDWNSGADHRPQSRRSTKNDDYITMRQQQHQPPLQSDEDTLSTSSSSGESTAVTGVSDTHRNSSDRGSSRRMSTLGSYRPSTPSSRKYSQVQKKTLKGVTQEQQQQQPPPMDILKNFMSLGEVRNNRHLVDASEVSDFSDSSTLKSGSTNFYYKRNGDGSPPAELRSQEDMDKIEIVSSKSLSIHNVPISHSNADGAESPSALMQELTSHQNPMVLPATKVFRVEVNPSSHGMQIALGLKDRVRKSKDLKYAWKRFVNIATSKFQSGGSGGSSSGGRKRGSLDALDKSSVLSDGDEGISSLHDESLTVLDEPHRSATSANKMNVSRTPSISSDLSARPGVRCDPDSGYMSADSNESKMNSKKLYERFNFRAVAGKGGRQQSSCGGDNEVDFAQKNMNRMQEIKETSQEQERSHSRTSSVHTAKEDQDSMRKQSHPHPKPSVTGFIPKRKAPLPAPHQLLHRQHQLMQSAAAGIEPIDVNVFSSDDDEKFSSSGEELESETDDEELSMDEMCESGAESVETNSVFFKNVRKTNSSSNQHSNHGCDHSASGSSKKS